MGPGLDKAQPYLDAWRESFPIATVLVLCDLTLLWSNAAAEELSAAGAILLAGGVLALPDRAAHQALRQFVESLCAPVISTFNMSARAGVFVVRGESLAPTGLRPGAALMFYPTEGDGRYVWADIGQIFGLTRAEAGVVKRLVAGDRADDIAEDMGITVETVRTHIRRAYAKMGVSTREQMFAAVTPYRLG